MSEFSRGRGTGLPQVRYDAVTKSYAYSPISSTLDATATATLINAVGHREARKQSTGRCFWFCASVPEAAIPALPSTPAPPLSKQLLEMPLNIAVAFARGGLQTRAVEDGHAAIRVMDQVSVFQRTSGDGHTGPANPQHQ
jgi:hypothetical protein